MSTTSTRTDIDGVHWLPTLPAHLIISARARIDDWLAAGMPDADRADMSDADRRRYYADVSYGDEVLRWSSPLRACFDHCTASVLELIGSDAILSTVESSVQVALRYPGQAGYPHLDGMDEAGRRDDPQLPAAVLAIYLSDVGPDDGALGTWPHLRDRLRVHGRRCLADRGYDPDCRAYRALMAEAARSAPVAVTGGAGTAYLFHGGLPHCNLANSGTGTRYALFMRYYRSSHYPLGIRAPNRGRGFEILTEPPGVWAHPPGHRPAPER